MRTQRYLLTSILSALLLITILPGTGLSVPTQPIPVQEPPIGASISKAVDYVLEVVQKWNNKVDQLTNAAVRSQLQSRMFKLQRQMQELELRKTNLLESLQAENYIRDNVETDISRCRVSLREIRESMVNISTQLGMQSDFDGSKYDYAIKQELDAKGGALTRASQMATSQAVDKQRLTGEIQQAIERLRQAEQLVHQCLTNLQKPL